jgi:hypothetical protein
MTHAPGIVATSVVLRPDRRCAAFATDAVLFDIVLKPSLGNNGGGFARSAFETRPFFEADT